MNEHANCVYCVLSCNELNFFELKFHTLVIFQMIVCFIDFVMRMSANNPIFVIGFYFLFSLWFTIITLFGFSVSQYCWSLKMGELCLFMYRDFNSCWVPAFILHVKWKKMKGNVRSVWNIFSYMFVKWSGLFQNVPYCEWITQIIRFTTYSS